MAGCLPFIISIVIWFITRTYYPENLFVVSVVLSVYIIIFALIIISGSRSNRKLIESCVSTQRYKIAIRITEQISNRSVRADTRYAPFFILLPLGFLLSRFIFDKDYDTVVSSYWWMLLISLFGVASYFQGYRPAMVLLLGTSSTQRVKFQEKLINRLDPFRVVSLLESSSVKDRLNSAPGDCLRVTWGNWRKAVRDLIGVVVVVIMDERVVSENTGVEKDEIIRANAMSKTIWLTNDVNPEYEIVVNSEEDAIIAARNKILSIADSQSGITGYLQNLWLRHDMRLPQK